MRYAMGLVSIGCSVRLLTLGRIRPKVVRARAMGFRAIMLDRHFVAGIRFLVLETIAPARRGCGQLDTVCAWRVAASGG